MSRGEDESSPYGAVNGEDVVAIPARACVGRIGALGKTFSGYIDFQRGDIRFDCAEEMPFYLIVNLHEIPALACMSDAPDGRAAVERVRMNAA